MRTSLRSCASFSDPSIARFYVLLPATPPTHSDPRTFVVLPPRSSPAFAYYVPAPNCVAVDEVQAHMGMFHAGNNDGYYRLGLAVAQVIRDALGTQPTPKADPSGDGK